MNDTPKKIDGRIYIFDIDGTICTQHDGEYDKAVPFPERIAWINELYDEGHTIKFFTARGSGSGKDWSQKTLEQLRDWEVDYDELIMGKPHGDIFVDDKAIKANTYFKDLE